MTRLDTFLAVVRACVGTPVRHRGRVPGRGLDCVGVPIVALAACGVMVPEPPPYGSVPSPSELRAGLLRIGAQVPIPERRPGDVLVMFWRGEPAHVGVLVEDDLVVHARARTGVVAMERLGRGHRLAECWRLTEVR